MEKIKIYYFIIFLSFLIPIKENDYNMPTGEDYIVGEDGIKRMYVNVWGHVKNPGTYLVYENIDVTTLLSIAGGPLNGANLSKIKIISHAQEDNSRVKIINFNKILDTNKNAKINFYPYDTITIEPTLKFYFRQNANLINVLLQLITLTVTLNN